MAAPNFAALSTITGKTSLAIATTSLANVVTNSAGSNNVLRVNSLILTNYSTSTVTSNVNIVRSATNYPIAGTLSIPGNSTLSLVGKDISFYLEEGDYIQVNANAATSLSVTTSYEIIT